MIKLKRADMSLETIGKAVLVLAVIVILLVIFTNMLYGGSGQINNVAHGENGVVKNAQICITQPNHEDCQSFINTKKKEESDTDAPAVDGATDLVDN